MNSYKKSLAEARALGQTLELRKFEVYKQIENSNILGTAIHPDTGKIIPLNQRLSSFIPLQLPVLSLHLLTKNPISTFNTLLLCLSQIHYAGMNFGNRNATIEYTKRDIFVGYLGAVTASVSISLYMRSYFGSHLA